MASQNFYAIAFICLIPFSFSTSWAHPYVSFQFIKNLQGAKKGDKVEGIHELQKYLHNFGYLIGIRQANEDYFDESLETAIKTYQLNFNLKPTGELDHETVSLMMMPRCGMPDIVDGRTRMNVAGKYNIDFAFFDGSPKWPLTRKILYWGLQPGTRRDVIDPILIYSLSLWTGVAPFTYKFVDENLTTADIRFGFLDKSSGMAANTLAFSYPPTNGTVFFNADLNWSFEILNATQGAYHFGTIGLHEFGHVLGLAHSSVENAVMWPYIGMGETKRLQEDDIQGMKGLYASS